MTLTRFSSLLKSRLRTALDEVKAAQTSILLRQSLKCASHLTLPERQVLYKLSAGKKSIVEIGSYLGASACCFAAAPKPACKTVYCIDTWTNNGMTEGIRDTWQIFRDNTKRYSSTIVPLRGWSAEMTNHLARYIKKIDLLFVDGAHDYDSVKTDWESYKVFLEIGSVVVFHDTGWAKGVQTVIKEDVINLIENYGELPNMWWGSLGKKP